MSAPPQPAPADPLLLGEEPIDGPAATALVAALGADVERRYSGNEDDETGGGGGHARDEDGGAGEGVHPAPRALPAHHPGWAVVAADVARPRGAFVVARQGGEPVACGALRPLPGGGPGVAEVKRMYTVPGARRRGAARAVLRRLVAVARDLGYREVVLETGTAQPEALAMYASEGWHPVAPYGEWADAPSSRCFGLVLDRDPPAGQASTASSSPNTRG